MPCSKEDLATLFYNVSSSFLFCFLFFYFSSIILHKLFSFLSNISIFQRAQNGYEAGTFSEEEEEEGDRYFHREYVEREHLVADIYHDGETLQFVSPKKDEKIYVYDEEIMNSHENFYEDQYHETFDSEQMFDNDSSYSDPKQGKESSLGEDVPSGDTDSGHEHSSQDHEDGPTSPITIELKNGLVDDDNGKSDNKDSMEDNKVKTSFSKDEKFLIFEPPKLETKKIQVPHEKDDNYNNEEIFGDSCTVGSTSKSSSEWRSSIFCRDSGTEDPFSSSSRRSCPKWESYTVFQKYDEEMLFLDRISAQKLHETESLKSFQACPRSISDRIVHKLSTMNKKESERRQNNPYHELEAAYVAQICLTWEALNWNYKKFQGMRSSRKGDIDPGCPARVAQQFQQFQVLLQRYIENEPYEHGRRPEIYAKMRILAPKLLQVPEYRDSDDEQKEEGFNSRISSASFLMIMEDGIQTFMNFLKADKVKHCQIITALFRRNRRISVDPTLLHMVKKANEKKKMKLSDLRRPRNCLRKRRLKVEEEMEILMGLIDLKVVSRVLRMADLSEEQLRWCEEKMGKVRVCEGKLQRDSSPLFFPAH